MKCSNRISGMQESPIRKLVPYANAARANGKKVYPLNIGQPDIKTPEGYFDAIKNFKQEVLEYADSHGDFTLIDEISQVLCAQQHGLRSRRYPYHQRWF